MKYHLRFAFLAPVVILFVAAAGAVARDSEDPAATPVTKVELADAERRLVADVEQGKFKTIPFAEAALIGSGVTDAGKRKVYLTKIDNLEARARKAVASAKTDAEKGQKLLAFLHAPGGPMKAYVADQTSLAALIDTGSFNCVSSAVLYNVLAERLGLEVCAVEMPKHSHVFSLLRDGERDLDVETTDGRGFNPKRKKNDPAAQAKNRREIGTAGLVAIVAANRCATLGEAKQFPESFRAGMFARELDRGLKGAEMNFRAALDDWCRAVAADGRIEAALELLEHNGTTLKPDERHDHVKGIYFSRLEVLLKRKDYESAARMYAEATRRHKGEKKLADHCRRQARACFDEWAVPHFKDGDWARAVEIYELATEVLPDEPDVRKKLDFCRKKLAG